MAFSSCFCYPQFSLKNDCSGLTIRSHHIVGKDRKLFSSLRSNSIELFGQRVARVGADLHRDWNFLGGSRIIVHPKLTNFLVYRKSSGVNASCRSCLFLECNPILARPPAVFYENISLAMGVRCLEQNYMLSEPRKPGTLLVHALSWIPTGTYGQAGTLFLSPLGSFLRDTWTKQIASSVFTLGTAAVLPFYTLMVVAPKAEVTRKSMESSIPYIVLGLLYAFLLYLSWTPDTMRLMFASQYWLPELPGIAKMFSNEMTLASAWIHLLAVDLFAARQVFNDGLENEVETRHSVSLCLLFCPIGIATHFITKALTKGSGTTRHDM